MAVTILGDSSIVTNLENYFYTETELNTSAAGGSVHWDNITNTPTTLSGYGVTDSSSDLYWPSSGSYRNYTDVLKLSFSKEKEALIPLTDDQYLASKGNIVPQLPNAREFFTGELQIGEWYRVTGTGSIYHDKVTYDANEEFKAISPSFIVASGSPVVKLGTQHAEFEDCSQIYNPQIIEVGDYYYMYYAGNTQKYQNIGLAIDPEGSVNSITDVYDSGDKWQNNADYSRRDQVFLATKNKSEELYSGEWRKWKGGREPVLFASGEHSEEDDASNAWFRGICYDGTYYVMLYTGDSDTDGSNHTSTHMVAYSTDGINWTKNGSLDPPTGTSLGTIFYHNSAYYIVTYNLSAPQLYKSTTSPTAAGFATSFSQISADLIPAMSIPYTTVKFNNKIYLSGRKASEGAEKIYVWECSDNGTDLETPGNWSETGLLYETPSSDSDFTGETINEVGGSITANYHCIVPVDENNGKWAVFYSYYKDKFARYPWVPEAAIRMFTFTNTSAPIPSSS